MIEYEVEGQMYTVARKFRGIITKTRISPGKLYEDSGAYVTEKDYLYIQERRDEYKADGTRPMADRKQH